MTTRVSMGPQFIPYVSAYTTDPDTVVNGPALLSAIYVNVAPSHDVLIKNGSTTVFTIPANTGVGTQFFFSPDLFGTSLIVDWNASASAGSITVSYAPNH